MDQPKALLEGFKHQIPEVFSGGLAQKGAHGFSLLHWSHQINLDPTTAHPTGLRAAAGVGGTCQMVNGSALTRTEGGRPDRSAGFWGVWWVNRQLLGGQDGEPPAFGTSEVWRNGGDLGAEHTEN